MTQRPTFLDMPKRSESVQIRLNCREIREFWFKAVLTVLAWVKMVGMVKSIPNSLNSRFPRIHAINSKRKILGAVSSSH